MFYKQLLDQQAAPPTILNSGAKSLLTKAFVQLAPFLDQTNTISLFSPERLQLSCYIEFWRQESFNKGFCPVGATSWPDKHNIWTSHWDARHSFDGQNMQQLGHCFSSPQELFAFLGTGSIHKLHSTEWLYGKNIDETTLHSFQVEMMTPQHHHLSYLERILGVTKHASNPFQGLRT